MRLGRRHPVPSAADALRPLLYGDQPLEAWPPADAGADEAPWSSFARARELHLSGDQAGAVAIWHEIVGDPLLGSRHVLQAWHFLRAAGVEPGTEVETFVLAAVAEVSVDRGHDLLVAYRDGGVRYLNRSGSVAVVDAHAAHSLRAPLDAWLDVADRLALVVGVWDSPTLPALGRGETRVLMLTPAGPRFGQGPDGVLRQDSGAGAFLAAATEVLVAVTALA